MTPIALSKLGVPDSTVLMLSEYPLHGLGLISHQSKVLMLLVNHQIPKLIHAKSFFMTK